MQTSLEPVNHFLLKGSPQVSCEFAATLQLQQPAPDSRSAFGLALFDGSDMLKICLSEKKSGWKISIEGIDSSAIVNVEYELPIDFDPYTWHTLRLILTNDQLELSLDGPRVSLLTLSSAKRNCGLFTRNASVAFISVWQTTQG